MNGEVLRRDILELELAGKQSKSVVRKEVKKGVDRLGSIQTMGVGSIDRPVAVQPRPTSRTPR